MWYIYESISYLHYQRPSHSFHRQRHHTYYHRQMSFCLPGSWASCIPTSQGCWIYTKCCDLYSYHQKTKVGQNPIVKIFIKFNFGYLFIKHTSCLVSISSLSARPFQVSLCLETISKDCVSSQKFIIWVSSYFTSPNGHSISGPTNCCSVNSNGAYSKLPLMTDNFSIMSCGSFKICNFMFSTIKSIFFSFSFKALFHILHNRLLQTWSDRFKEPWTCLSTLK